MRCTNITKLSKESIVYVKARREGMSIREAYKHAGFQCNKFLVTSCNFPIFIIVHQLLYNRKSITINNMVAFLNFRGITTK